MPLGPLLLLASVSCPPPAQDAPARTTTEVEALLDATPPKPASPVERVAGACRRFVAGAYRGDRAPFARLYDRARIRDVAVAGLEMTPGRAAFAEEVLTSLDPWDELVAVLEAGGDLRFLRAWEADGTLLALCRVTLLTEFDYHRYTFAPTPAGELTVVDLHRFSEGEGLVASVRSLVAASGPAGEPPPLLEALGEVVAGMEADDLPAARRAFARLPANLATEPDLLHTWVELAAREDGDAWADAIERFEELHPDRTDALHARLTLGLTHDSRAVTEAAIQRLFDRTQDAAFVEYLRGSLDRRVAAWESARSHYRRALGFEPAYEDPLWDLLQVNEALGDFEDYGRVLDRLELRFGYDFAEALLEDRYAAFVASAAYPRWLQRRTERLDRVRRRQERPADPASGRANEDPSDR